MKVLFIGGTGTISSYCSKLCVERGMELWLINRGTRHNRIPEGINYIQGDINKDYGRIREDLKLHKWDCVVDWTVFTSEQVLRDIELFTGKTEQYIFISSTSIYKTTTADNKITENHPVGNLIPYRYAEDKIKCETILLKAYKDNGFPVVIVRPGHTYAEFTIPSNIPGLGYGIVERFKKRKEIIIHDNGLSLWTLTHSADFAVGFAGLIGLQESTGEIFHITNSEALSWLEIFLIFQDVIGIEAKFEFIPSQAIYKIDNYIGASLLGDKAKNLIFDNRKIKRFVPSYNPKISFREGVNTSLQWHDMNRDEIYYNKQSMERIDRIIRSHKKESM